MLTQRQENLMDSLFNTEELTEEEITTLVGLLSNPVMKKQFRRMATQVSGALCSNVLASETHQDAINLYAIKAAHAQGAIEILEQLTSLPDQINS